MKNIQDISWSNCLDPKLHVCWYIHHCYIFHIFLSIALKFKYQNPQSSHSYINHYFINYYFWMLLTCNRSMWDRQHGSRKRRGYHTGRGGSVILQGGVAPSSWSQGPWRCSRFVPMYFELLQYLISLLRCFKNPNLLEQTSELSSDRWAINIIMNFTMYNSHDVHFHKSAGQKTW